MISNQLRFSRNQWTSISPLKGQHVTGIKVSPLAAPLVHLSSHWLHGSSDERFISPNLASFLLLTTTAGVQCSYSSDAIRRTTGETCHRGCRDLGEQKGIDENRHSLSQLKVNLCWLRWTWTAYSWPVNPLAVGKSLVGRSIRCATGCNDQPDNNILPVDVRHPSSSSAGLGLFIGISRINQPPTRFIPSSRCK
jgi:hypothetical protein